MDDVYAVCLKCGNEWKVRKIDSKKRKCPACGSYRTRLKSELEAEKSTEENKTVEGVEKSVEKEEKKEEKKKKQSRKTENEILDLDDEDIEAIIDEKPKKSKKEKASGWLLWIGVVILAIAAGYFFLGRIRSQKSERVDDESRISEQRRSGRNEGSGRGFPTWRDPWRRF